MGKIRRGNYIFVFWPGDHPPKHVHVYRDAALVVKWDLVHGLEIQGKATRQIKRLIADLQSEGKL